MIQSVNVNRLPIHARRTQGVQPRPDLASGKGIGTETGGVEDKGRDSW
jgi:hypothetical protein